jgi:hypothetical protein
MKNPNNKKPAEAGFVGSGKALTFPSFFKY